jgi:O-antigen/teichoic acid export membrane protein
MGLRIANNCSWVEITRRWGSRLLLTGGAQVGVQLSGFIGGVVVIRMLAQEQYANYTIAMAFLGLLTVISDAGISTAMVSFASQTWRDESRLKIIFQEAMHLRRQLSLVAVTVSFPCLIIIVCRQGETWINACILALAVLPQYWFTLNGQLRETLLKIQDRLTALQLTQLGQSAIRCAFLYLALILTPVAWAALLAAGAAQFCGNIVLSRLSRNYTLNGENDIEVRARYRAYVSRTLPSALYYGFSGQVSILIITFVGNAQEVAHVGVAGRLSMICIILGSIVNVLVMVRFSKLCSSVVRLNMIFFSIITLILAFGLALSSLVELFPEVIPLIAGERYNDLENEVIWSVMSAILSLASGVAYNLCAVRGMIMKGTIIIPAAVGAMFVSAFFSDLTNALGIFRFQALYGAIVLVVYCFFFLANSNRKLNQ